MMFTLRLKLEAYHKPTQKWHVHETTHGLRAVSRKHALGKGLKVITGWPGYQDRVWHENWVVDASASIVESVDKR